MLFVVNTSFALLNELPPYQHSVICGAYLTNGAVMAMMSKQSAPPYAQEKYGKQIQFYSQGQLNLKKIAQKTKDYDEKKYDEDVKTNANTIRKTLATPDGAGGFLMVLQECVDYAGLNMSDFPK